MISLHEWVRMLEYARSRGKVEHATIYRYALLRGVFFFEHLTTEWARNKIVLAGCYCHWQKCIHFFCVGIFLFLKHSTHEIGLNGNEEKTPKCIIFQYEICYFYLFNNQNPCSNESCQRGWKTVIAHEFIDRSHLLGLVDLNKIFITYFHGFDKKRLYVIHRRFDLW